MELIVLLEREAVNYFPSLFGNLKIKFMHYFIGALAVYLDFMSASTKGGFLRY